MDYYNLAIKRESTRSFKKRPVSDRQLAELTGYFSQCARLVPEIKTDIRILGAEGCSLLKGCAGYHDLMIEAPHYLVIASEPAPSYLENAGFMGEDLVLKMTELEIETCWITINDEAEAGIRLGLTEDMRVSALIAFGNATTMLPASRLDIKSVSDILIKKRSGFVAPKLAVDQAVYTAKWGESANISELPINSSLYQAFIAACCAPSHLNLQRYRFILDGSRVLFVTLPDEQTSDSDRQLNVGIAMLHFAGVMGNHHGNGKGWSLGAPEAAYEIPEGAEIAGYYDM